MGGTKLRQVVRVTSSHVFFAPQEGKTLDLKTLSSAPPTHRSLLQKNGLIAKVCLGVPGPIPPVDRVSGGALRDPAVEIFTAEGRLQLWKSILTASGLLEMGAANSLVVPEEFSQMAFPLLSEEELSARIAYATKRKNCAEVNDIQSCAPVLDVLQMSFKERGIRVSVGVIWMPRFRCNLAEWSECLVRAGQPMVERHLCMVVHHVAAGLCALQNMPQTDAAAANASGRYDALSVYNESIMSCRTTLEMTDVLVSDGGSEPSFALTTSQMNDVKKVAAAADDLSSLFQYPYLAPEQVDTCGVPTRHRKYDVWAMGMIAYHVAAGTPMPKEQVMQLKRRGEQPLNHPSITPDAIVKRVRRDVESSGCSSHMVSLLCLLLAQDYRTRPSLIDVVRQMQYLDCPSPIIRIPFAIGSFDLLRLPCPQNVQLNASARKYITSDICCLCKDERNLTSCKERDHLPSMTSPSWAGNELLPGIEFSEPLQMAYMYPLLQSTDDREKRRLLLRALHSSGSMSVNASCASLNTITTEGINRTSLFQLLGGFAVFQNVPANEGERRERSVVREVLIPFPANTLPKSESALAVHQIHFTAALPWPSYCTRTLQKKGRICNHVPFLFGSGKRGAKWFAWLLPGETFKLENGQEWKAATEGGFVLWYDDNLEPSSLDRYFTVTSVRGLSLKARVSCTVLPDNSFRHTRGDGFHQSRLMRSSADLGDSMADTVFSRQASAVSRGCNGLLKRRSSVMAAPMNLPVGQGIVEVDGMTRPMSRVPSTLNSRHESTLNGTEGRRGERQQHNTPASFGSRRRQSMAFSLPTNEVVRLSDSPRNGFTPMSDHKDQKGLSRHQLMSQPPLAPRVPMSDVPALSSEECERVVHEEELVNRRLSEVVGVPSMLSGKNRASRRQRRTSAPEQCHTNGAQWVPQSMNHHFHPKGPDATRPSRNDSPAHCSTPSYSAHQQNNCQGSDQFVEFCNGNGRNVPRPLGLDLDGCDQAISALNVFGRWYPPTVVDAEFEALTFYISSSGEHGPLHPPVVANKTLCRELRVPSTATFMSFASNQLPLLQRNHPNGRQEKPAGTTAILNHHGFVFYDASENPIGLLALRCSFSPLPDTSAEEFVVPLTMMKPEATSPRNLRKYYVSYLSGITMNDNSYDHSSAHRGGKILSPLQNNSEDADPAWNAARIGSKLLRNAPNQRSTSNGPSDEYSRPGTGDSDAQDLAMSTSPGLLKASGESNRFLISTGQRTNDQDSLPVCWMGFHAEQLRLMFTDKQQTTWYPFQLATA